MEKLKQRNWLIIITILLFLSSLLVLFITAKKELGLGSCIYNGVEYEENSFVPNYEGRNDCYCTWNGEVACDDSELSISYESFVSDGLTFSYSFKNFLEKESPDLTNISLLDVNHQGTRIEVILEREALCTTEGSAPVQVGLYEKKDNSLVLTNITNRDETLYSKSCVIGNTFIIDSFDVSNTKSYSLLYQNDGGQLYDLNACFLNGKLYGVGDVFKDSQTKKLCTCEGPEITCEDL